MTETNEEKPNKWKLTIGIHRGTLMNRDVEEPKELDTYDDVLSEYRKAKKNYAQWGYVIWFANVTSPSGEQSCLESNGYSR